MQLFYTIFFIILSHTHTFFVFFFTLYLKTRTSSLKHVIQSCAFEAACNVEKKNLMGEKRI